MASIEESTVTVTNTYSNSNYDYNKPMRVSEAVVVPTGTLSNLYQARSETTPMQVIRSEPSAFQSAGASSASNMTTTTTTTTTTTGNVTAGTLHREAADIPLSKMEAISVGAESQITPASIAANIGSYVPSQFRSVYSGTRQVISAEAMIPEPSGSAYPPLLAPSPGAHVNTRIIEPTITFGSTVVAPMSSPLHSLASAGAGFSTVSAEAEASHNQAAHGAASVQGTQTTTFTTHTYNYGDRMDAPLSTYSNSPMSSVTRLTVGQYHPEGSPVYTHGRLSPSPSALYRSGSPSLYHRSVIDLRTQPQRPQSPAVSGSPQASPSSEGHVKLNHYRFISGNEPYTSSSPTLMANPRAPSSVPDPLIFTHDPMPIRTLKSLHTEVFYDPSNVSCSHQVEPCSTLEEFTYSSV